MQVARAAAPVNNFLPGNGGYLIANLGGETLLTLRGKTGWREVEIGRGSSEATCPVAALKRWLEFARIAHGPVFRRVQRGKVGPSGSTIATSRGR